MTPLEKLENYTSENPVPQTGKKAPVTADSIREEFISCLPQGAAEPTEKQIEAFSEIMVYHPGFKKDPNGVRLLAKLYAEGRSSMLNTIYDTAEFLKKNSRNGAK